MKINSEMHEYINSFNTKMVNAIINEMNKIVQENIDLDPLDLYSKLYIELKEIQNDASKKYGFTFNEDILIHIEDYIEPYYQKARRQFKSLLNDINNTKNTDELKKKITRINKIFNEEPYCGSLFFMDLENIENTNSKTRKKSNK